MPIAANPLGTVKPPQEEVPKIYSETYRHSIVDSAYQPEQSILVQVDGTPRLVEMYIPHIGADEEPFTFGPSDAPTYRSYSRIKRMIIWQEGAGSFNFDPETAESGAKYNGWWVAPGFQAPTRNMVFITDIGDGRAGVFQVSAQPEPRNLTANKAYYLEYEFLQILTREYAEILESRVNPVRDYTFSKDSALHGGSSVVTDSSFEVGQELFKWGQTIANNIMRNFYWNAERTISWLKDEKYPVYDQYLVNFITAVMPGDYRNVYPMINQFSTEYGGRDYGVGGDINIWEVLLRGDFNLLSQCSPNVSIIQTVRLWQTRLYGGLAASKFLYFVATDPERYHVVRDYVNSDGYPIYQRGSEESIPYIFSKDFYTGVPKGEFEEIVVAMVRDRLVDHVRLLNYCKTYFTLNRREQLYHGAILLALLRAARVIRSPLA